MAIILGGLCLFAWYVGRFYHHPGAGLYAGMAIAGVIYALTSEKTSGVAIESIIAFFLVAPLTYGLVLLAQIPLVVLGVTPYSAHTYFVRSIVGALAGAAFCALGSLVGTLKDAVDYGSIRERRKVAVDERLFSRLVSFRMPLSFLIAVGFVVSGHKLSGAAAVILGTAVGIIAAATQSVFAVLVDRKSVREGWFLILLVEFLLAMGLVAGLIDSEFNHSLVRPTLELVLPAAIACAVTYGLVHLIATLLRAASTTRAARPFGSGTSSQDDVSHQVAPRTEVSD